MCKPMEEYGIRIATREKEEPALKLIARGKLTFEEIVEDLELSVEKAEELAKNEIMELLQCGNQKALNFLKLLFQMQYAIKAGKKYLITAEDSDRFFEDYKGQEIVV